MSKKPKNTKSPAWQIWPSKAGWHILDVPHFHGFFVKVQNMKLPGGEKHLFASVPAQAMNQENEGVVNIDITMAKAELGDEHFGWYWQKVKIPDGV
ncbi:MAG: hypothetical protein VKP62_16755 [Candidatus Sericytochromatia bacterium]|nr:hypothetical protein [Candidatus Sericytochromatia bacterium]